jgi:hypothetical protein
MEHAGSRIRNLGDRCSVADFLTVLLTSRITNVAQLSSSKDSTEGLWWTEDPSTLSTLKDEQVEPNLLILEISNPGVGHL